MTASTQKWVEFVNLALFGHTVPSVLAGLPADGSKLASTPMDHINQCHKVFLSVDIKDVTTMHKVIAKLSEIQDLPAYKELRGAAVATGGSPSADHV